ncbi:hypothetical protein SISNIDRAFT_478213 [Sistotremastrum niveocremeum HHB9708]|uniref:VLRF1 domain-containing protein n=1 Tax=Sistotremastrum niveocremeum HHB9708 TaxID=1314777 RepID=A0A164VQN5_9AGAM|nr:hypothetical protein SISNIDRAFT_478213 [Sistotremastrum niveocremeum HHB9708]
MSNYIFALPQELLDTLTPRLLITPEPPRPSSPAKIEETPTNIAGARACNICPGAFFADVEAQRSHFRSDWHRYNVKVRLSQGKAVDLASFTTLLDELEDSISGSGSDSDSQISDESSTDTVNALLQKTRLYNGKRSPSPDAAISVPRTALTWFHSPPSTQIGIYNAIFPLKTSPSSYLETLKRLQTGGENGRIWSMFMVAGGHFAGLVVRVCPPDEQYKSEDEDAVAIAKKKRKPPPPKPDFEILHHKTFHRYTTRRKQGGSQSTNDKAKGNAKSAGATLRRYGEQALKEDIQNLLSEWAEEVQLSERIWLRASSSNRKIFWDYENAQIAKGDNRLRGYPFPTRRPTQSELMRCLNELTRAKVTHWTEAQLQSQDEEYLASLPKPKPAPVEAIALPPPPKEIVPKLSKEEEALREKWRRVLDMTTKGRLDALTQFWKREGESLGGVDAHVPEWTGERGSTLLQVATISGQEDVVQWLLEDLRANPTLPLSHIADDESELQAVESDHSDTMAVSKPSGPRRTAYDLARTRELRNVFRRCAASHPDWWDWYGDARVPSGLTKDKEEEQEEKKKVRRKGLKDKVRERVAKEKAQVHETTLEEPASAKITESSKPKQEDGPRKLGGAPSAAEGLVGLTPEMRAKIERERRARAAEARMKALGSR